MKLKTVILAVNPCVVKGEMFSSFPLVPISDDKTIALNGWHWKEATFTVVSSIHAFQGGSDQN